jgi:3-oxoacyl-[acyl-carrier-protein] synthase-3
MAFLQFQGISIKALAAAVPKNKIVNKNYTDHFSAEEVNEIVIKTGIEERRFAPSSMTASDLCFAAAESILNKLQIERSEIDVVLFVSQTADYRMPATAIILQDRLGLPKSTAAFDINIGCSGFIYGLSVAYMYAQQPHIRKVLLLDGETRSRIYSPKDRKTAFLFGDGGAAALIEKDPNARDSHFLLSSDGSRQGLIKMDAGGYRNPSTPESLQEKVVDEYGNVRSDEHGYMNGADVFSFVLREIPKAFKELLQRSEMSIDTVGAFYFHQANKFMNDYLGKKLKVPNEKAHQSLHKYGNTSSVSIPLGIVDDRAGSVVTQDDWVLSGFGVGMSWATCHLNLTNMAVLPLVEID